VFILGENIKWQVKMDLRSLVCKILDLSFIPEEIKELHGRVALHISDTPSTFYNTLDRLVKTLDPPWIFHTGDLVDQVKIGMHRRDKDLYSIKLRRLRSILEYGSHNQERKIFITLGNHDIEDTARKIFRKSHIFNRTAMVEIEGLQFNMSHYFSLLPGGQGTYNLYGHNTFIPSEDTKKGIFLNGLLKMNLITIPEGEIYKIDYPRYVNDHRTLRHKTGL